MKYEQTREERPIMIATDRFLDDHIGIKLLEKNEKERANASPSGKLSAGKLAWPLQWQILNKIGIYPRPVDEYVIRKFLRGNHIEDWFLSNVPGVITPETNESIAQTITDAGAKWSDKKKQWFVEYNDCIGYVDSFMDTSEWNNPSGIIPVEVKSVANAKFRRVIDQGADRSHILQNGLYALATGMSRFAIAYIAADDYRVKVMIYETAQVKDTIDSIIDRYHAQGSVVPVFEPEEPWQSNIKYNSYPDWSGLDQDQIDEKVRQHEEEKQKAKEESD